MKCLDQTIKRWVAFEIYWAKQYSIIDYYDSG